MKTIRARRLFGRKGKQRIVDINYIGGPIQMVAIQRRQGGERKEGGGAPSSEGEKEREVKKRFREVLDDQIFNVLRT